MILLRWSDLPKKHGKHPTCCEARGKPDKSAIFIKLAFVIWACVLPVANQVKAETPVDQVRLLLDAGDIAGLENVLAELHQDVIDGGSAKDLRDIASRLFQTTHPQRIEVIEKWHAERHESPFAVAAEAWVAIRAVELLGSEYEIYREPKVREAMQPWQDARSRAHALARQAAANPTGFVPGLDAGLVAMEMRYATLDEAAPLATRLIEIAPERESVLRISRAAQIRSSSGGRDVANLCLMYGQAARDYDADLCMTELAVVRHVDADIRARAEDLLWQLEEPTLDAARLVTFLRHQRDYEGTPERIFEIHRTALTHDSDPVRYLSDAGRIARFFQNDGYAEEARARVRDMVSSRLEDDPFNHKLLRFQAQLLLEDYQVTPLPDLLHQARRSWEDGMWYGEMNDSIWRLGASLAIADRHPSDYQSQQVFFENMIAYSGQNLQYLLENVYAVDIAYDAATSGLKDADRDLAKDLEQSIESMECPMLRAALTASAMCRSISPPVPICDPDLPLFQPIPGILEMGRDGMCVEVSSQPLSDLRYDPVPFADVRLPWRN
ncbi:hypothetical protein EU803_00530 [Loktanella sp. IMCC34160]|uniref:hypothetical protein n=1 Tax=Loktanella sp. IMCC34160 TaxID=2510646 RepID=UPI00101DB4DB|nr:hypothetical protein [Loktanella sp. IMCC34160]RYG92625.1 hypothetical protein EU803_00530 [Loktanella sp. IMCC34160]